MLQKLRATGRKKLSLYGNVDVLNNKLTKVLTSDSNMKRRARVSLECIRIKNGIHYLFE